MFRKRIRSLWTVCLLAASLPVCAAPLPDDPALAAPVTLSLQRHPIGLVLAQLSRLGGIELTVEDHLGHEFLSIGARECPLRDLMGAIAAFLQMEWSKQEGGGYLLIGPAIIPPVVDTRRLIAKLAAALPAWARAAPGGTVSDSEGRALVAAAYASLRGPQLDIIEEGGSVPLAELPAVRRAVAQYLRASAAAMAAHALQPAWLLPAQDLGVRIRDASWSLVRRAPGPDPSDPDRQIEWQPAGDIHYWAPQTSPLPPPPDGVSVGTAALEVAEKAGIGVVLPAGPIDLTDPRGSSVEEQLQSVLPAGSRGRYRWQPEGKAYWLRDALRADPPKESAELGRRRKALAAVLPAEYGPLITMGFYEQWRAVRAPAAKLCRALCPGGEAKERFVPVMELPPEQQAWLYGYLQAKMVAEVWCSGAFALPLDPQRATLSLDLSVPREYPPGLGYPRCLQVCEEGERRLTFRRLEQLPPLLPLLPAEDPVQAREADFTAKEEPVADVVARLAEQLKVPLVAREPKAETKLTGDFRQQPARLLFHWIERRTGLQWRKRGSTYVLAAPVAVGADMSRAVDALLRDIPPKTANLVARSISDNDRALLLKGDTPFSDLSPKLQDAIRETEYRRLRGSAQGIGLSWERLVRLGEGRLRLSDDEVVLDVPRSHPVVVGRVPGRR